MYWGYALYRTYVEPNGGPMVPVLYGFLPPGLQFHRVHRDYFDIMVMMVLLFQFMATWELMKGPRQWIGRSVLGAVASAGVVAVWTCPAGSWPLGDTHITQMEVRFGVLAAAFSAVGLAWGWRPGRSSKRAVSWAWAVRSGAVRWATLMAVFSALIALYNQHPYFVGTTESPKTYFENWRLTVIGLWVLFGIVGLPYAIWSVRMRPRISGDLRDPGLLLFYAGRCIYRAVRSQRWEPLALLPHRRVRSAALDIGVKAFFLPLMVTFLYQEAGGFNRSMITAIEHTDGEGIARLFNIPGQIWSYISGEVKYDGVLTRSLYHTARSGIFITDVGLGMLGYACSFWWLKNKTRSVDSTLSGWFVALICYPPLNSVTSSLLPYHQRHGAPPDFFRYLWVRDSLYAVAFFGFIIYVWATIAFGLRFSNMTHRGIITTGPYRFVRHPAFAAKNMAWWAESVVRFGSWWQALFLLGWNFIYYLRAVTEERHLNFDPDYREYCKQVPYKFIPGIW